jgi:hypothetical protein
MVGFLAVGLITAGFGAIGLSYVVPLPSWFDFTFLAVAMATVVVGFVLCFPYLTPGSRGFELRKPAGKTPWWLATFVIVSFVAIVVLIVTSGSDHGQPEHSASGSLVLYYKGAATVVSRAVWLQAKARQTHVVIAFSNFFLCIMALWCIASRRGDPAHRRVRRPCRAARPSA